MSQFVDNLVKNLVGLKSLYEEGLVIKTSIDTGLQKILDKVLIKNLINQDKKYGWRGPISNNKEFFLKEEFYKKIKNPFPNKWFLAQVKKVSNKILIVAETNRKKDRFKENIYFI